MEIIKIIGIGITGAVCYGLLKETKPEIAFLITLACGIMIVLIVADYLAEILNTISALVSKTGINEEVISSIIKIIGVGYLTEFGANICEDAGSKSIADKVLFGGKVFIMLLSLPIITTLFNIIAGILQ